MKKLLSKALAFCLVMVVCVTCSLSTMTVQAATGQEAVFVEKEGTFKSTGDVYTFTTNSEKIFYLEMDVVDPSISVDVVITPLNGGNPISGSITNENWVQDKNEPSIYYDVLWVSVPAGSYQVKISSQNAGNYMAFGWLEDSISLSDTSVSLSAGQTKTLSVIGATETVQWSSSNTSVATVDSNGKVTAKKAGKATITAKTGGLELTCSVTVKKPVISTKAFTITAGQKRTLKVTGKVGKVTWKSSKKSVATVSSKGVVAAKKAGKAKITASVDGCKLTCNVTVKKNEYSVRAASNSEVPYNEATFQVTKISYNKKGQLVCKVQILNNLIYNIEQIRNFNITVYDKNNSAIASQTVGKKNFFVYSGSKKSLTITIPKSKVKKKNADLRVSTPRCSGSVYYRIR